ncbi:MAG TPA: transcriptional regulator [Bacteroidales bacterium]|nr:transcriptional regulator [Bacteroidales bacterium]
MSEEFDINNLNKIFESRIRLGVMSVLSVNDSIDFNTLKSLLKVTDGNLASHISALEKYNYIEVRKEFVGKKPRTTYRITDVGRITFAQHLSFLEDLIIKNKNK